MSIDVVTDYEVRAGMWKKIGIIFVILIVFILFGIFSNVFGIMGEKTPFVLKNCKLELEKLVSSGNSFSSKSSAIEEAKKYVNVNYTNISVSGEFDKCIGWTVEFMNDSIPVKKVLVCEKGWIYVYDRKCKEKDLLSIILDLYLRFFKYIFGWIK